MTTIQPTNKSAKDNILDYVMNTPHNTNRQILSDMLDDISEGGGIMPSGELFISNDGTYDVTDKATARVHIDLDNYIGSCTISIKSSDADKMTIQMPVMRYYSQVPEAFFEIKQISSGSDKTYFSFISEKYEDGRLYNSGRIYLDVTIDPYYVPAIDITQTVGNAPKIAKDSTSGKYYLYDLTDGDDIVLTTRVGK